MVTQTDPAKTQLLGEAADLARAGEPTPAGQAAEVDETVINRYYRHVALDDLADRSPADLVGAAASSAQLAAQRPQGTAKIRVLTPTVEQDGWQARGGRSVVEIVTDDMPFLVDSVTAELSRRGHGIHTLFHPVLAVDRDLAGKLREVYDADPAAGPAGCVVESWMHIEIGRLSDEAGVASSLEADLRRVLQDVREAVEDWPKMRAAALGAADALDGAQGAAAQAAGLGFDELSAGQELLRWLVEGHFTFLGYREYELLTENGEDRLRAVTGTGLGILRADQALAGPGAFSKLPPEVRARAREPRLLVLTKANSRSTVHRPGYLDYIGVKIFNEAGQVVGERRILGLFSAAAYSESVLRIPVVRQKVRQVLDIHGFSLNSHSGKDLLQILESYPRDELFQIPVAELADISGSVLHLQERRRVRLFLREDVYSRFFSALVYLPRDLYDTANRLKLQDILLEELHGDVIDYTVRSTESVLTRLHFVIRAAGGERLPEVDAEQIERRLARALRTWNDALTDVLNEQVGAQRANALLAEYADAFPESYKADFSPERAAQDLARIEAIHGDDRTDSSLAVYRRPDAAPDEYRLKIFRVGRMITLAEVLPVLQRFGVEVLEEQPYELHRRCGDTAWILDFGLRVADTDVLQDPSSRDRFTAAFAAVWSGSAENDGFNALVLSSGLGWRQASILRAYVKYLRQGGVSFSQDYFEQVLGGNTRIVRLLVRLFEASFDPAHVSAGHELVDGMIEEIEGALDTVASLDEDRILRSLLAVIRATLRTNFYQLDAEGGVKPYVSFKINAPAVPDLPMPRPKFEIWVYSARVEGVHLRFGKVARGGLRWSDRREDFRTEILGLAKAQMVKNVVIVPVGAKGGFVVKNPVDPSDREAFLAEGVACYQMFIRGLLDITDNLVDGQIVPPKDVVRFDGDDHYLVVAADKGTATFSDIANAVAADCDVWGSRGFWLGDAFASGGSVGYDHKVMGITSRGAWESVKRHFRELGVDTQTDPFTVVGIGDMSGDVFGNGLLRSRHAKLIAAFDHRHIFVDPDPDPERSFDERRRLFELPRSSWADYDQALISEGGGVFPRTAKSIPVTPQLRRALGLPEGALRTTPAELMRAILLAPVDLLWNGGIGTYVKSAGESHADVGDKANDAIRVNGGELRVRVVGEGGNLGCTQLGRIEYALQGGPEGTGGRMNTDALDNSAGVDTSDHEVNIKILVDQAVKSGALPAEERTALLSSMTDEIADLVLADNYGQNVALASSVAQAPQLLHVHARYMRALASAGQLNRELEFLPRERVIQERRQAGAGLTQPELAVLLAYTKIVLNEELLASHLLEDPYLEADLFAYFPSAVRERLRGLIATHPLRREIIATQVVNNLVNNAGTTFIFRMREETGAGAEEIARAHIVAREVFNLETFWTAVDELDNKVPAEVQTRMRLTGRRLTERASRWFLLNRKHPIDISAQVEAFGAGVSEVVAQLPKLLKGGDAAQLASATAELVEAGVPQALAARCAAASAAYSALDIVEVAWDSGRAPVEVAECYFDLVDRLGIGTLRDRITALPRTDRWESMARAAVREDLYSAQAALTFDVLAAAPGEADAEARYAAWVEKNQAAVERAKVILDEISSADSFDLAILSVALRVIRTLLRANAM